MSPGFLFPLIPQADLFVHLVLVLNSVTKNTYDIIQMTLY